MALHHVEIWVADIAEARREWGWILGRLCYARVQEWAEGESWQDGDGAYLTLTESPNLSAPGHDRRRAGINHLAFEGGDTTNVDALINESVEHGWMPLYADRYPHAGGMQHYAGWLENSSGFKVEIVAREK